MGIGPNSAATEAAMDGPNVSPVPMTLGPSHRQVSLCADIQAGNHKVYADGNSLLHQCRKNCMIGWNLGIRNGGQQKRSLYILELLPIDDMGVKIQAHLVQRLGNVADGRFAIPAIIEVHSQWSKAKVLNHFCNVSA